MCCTNILALWDYVLKDELSCAIRSDREKHTSPKPGLRSLPQATKKKTVAATYAFNVGETPEEVLFNINQYALGGNSTSRRHSGEVCAADIIILDIRQLNPRKIWSGEQNRQYLS